MLCVPPPHSVLDLFKHCHKGHWIQSTGEASPAFMHKLHRQDKVLPHGHLCRPGKDQTWLRHPCFHICTTRGQQAATDPGAANRLSYGHCGLIWARAGPLPPTDWAASAQGPSQSLMCISCDLVQRLMAQQYLGKMSTAPFPQGGTSK